MTTKTFMGGKYLFIILLIIVLLPSVGYSQNKVGSLDSNNVHPGQGLLPVPQKVSLSDRHYLLDDSWSIKAAGNLSKNDPAVISLTSELKERFGLRLKEPGRSGAHSIRLIVKPGSVTIGPTTDTNRVALKKQAYWLKLKPGRISITANGAPGLFYGVQTLIQLLQPDNGKIFFAVGEIIDWPDMDLRMIYWDDAHHLERLDAMKRAIRQASYYKINAFALKLEGHFQFESAKPIVEPYAYTPAEYQGLTDYAKAHYVELIPYLDAPAHISFILKHPEYAGLRAFPNSNYELSVTNPKADELILGMFDNLMEANRGGKYLLFSTDEAYYVGESESEKKRAEALGGNGRLYAEYITRIGNKLHEQERQVIFWGEYPLRPMDVKILPGHLINGEINDLRWNPAYPESYKTSYYDTVETEDANVWKSNGIRQLVYTSTQGSEPLFPHYYSLKSDKLLHSDNTVSDGLVNFEWSEGRVSNIYKTITSAIEKGKAELMGTVVAGWGDTGLHPETFWLGFAAGNAIAWNNDAEPKNLTNRFYRSFYGNKTVNMDKVYQLLSTQAQFYGDSWESEPSKNRTPKFGNSKKIYETPQPARDQTIPLPPVPSDKDLSLTKDWSKNNARRLKLTEEFMKDNDELMNLLHENLTSVDYQHYNLQVLYSVAQLCRQNLNMLLDLQRINDFLSLSSNAASTNPAVAVSLIDQALDQVKKIREERNEVLQAVTTVWYQDWYPRVAEANGRKYVDEVDDVKDHLPVRTVDMSYLIYRQLKYPLGKWAEEVVKARNQFAKRNNLPIRTETFNWETTEH